MRVTAFSGGFLLTLLLLVATAAPAHAADYTTSPRDGWVPNARILAIAHAGDRVIIGGDFTSLRNPATGESVARGRIAALDAATGDLIRTWSPSASGPVRALAVRDGRVFVGGDFTTVSGQARTRLAALDLASGGVVGGWAPAANGSVRALAAMGPTLYAGGQFTSVSGQTRTRLAAVDLASGALRAGWAPGADATVYTLAAAPDGASLLVGGLFRTLSGTARDYLGSVNAATGAVTSWRPPAGCIVPSNQCIVLDLAVDDGSAYAAIAGPGGRLTAYSLATGTRRWELRADGDVESVAVRDGKVFAGGHFCPDFAGFTRCDFAAVDAATGAVDGDFAPTSNGQIFALDAGPDALRAGGAYSRVNDQSLPYYAEFPVRSPSEDVTLVAGGSAWRYRDDGADLGTAWRSGNADDSAWPSGVAQLGFGDGDERTPLAAGHVTYYFRHAFTVTDPGTLNEVALSVLRDDGAVVYLNGVEVMRSNMPAGTVTAGTLAPSTIFGADENVWQTLAIDPGRLLPGRNTLAVEVHQAQATSSDMSFDLRLTAR
ncbi:PQQ-binding-like beta-propeller repeat protein [Planobispora rosea]|uniref:outer membrane protein assembly factor BamB family protein n=1 Tax=Planobispora rosea TaxID=35762 RepID=UPI00083B5B76|nr:PQQ-binding-like beta-propeller repeat protein [Planobispora rosea]